MKTKLVIVLAVVVLATFVGVIVGMYRELSRYKDDSRRYREICLHTKTVLRLDALEIQRKTSWHRRVIERVHEGNEGDGAKRLAACVPNGFDLAGWTACKNKNDLDCLARILTDASRSIVYP